LSWSVAWWVLPDRVGARSWLPDNRTRSPEPKAHSWMLGTRRRISSGNCLHGTAVGSRAQHSSALGVPIRQRRAASPSPASTRRLTMTAMRHNELNLATTGARPALLDVAHEELWAWLQAHGQPPLRARQIRRWLIAGRAETFEQMTDLP